MTSYSTRLTQGDSTLVRQHPGDSRWTLVAVPILGGPGFTSHSVAWLVLGSVLLVTAVLAAVKR